MSKQPHSKHFEICRLCLRQPEVNRNLNFLDIFKPLYDGKTLKEYIKDLFDLNVEPNDQKPRIICEVCYISMVNIYEIKKKAAESTVIINHLTARKFGSNMPRTSIASTSTPIMINNEESIQGSPLEHSQLISNKNETNLNGCRISNNGQGYISSKSLIRNHSISALNVDNESNNDSFVKTTMETIVLSDDEDSGYVNNIENEQTNVDLSYNEETVELSSDSELDENNLRNEYINNDTEQLYCCSISQKKNILNHDCSQHSKSFFTCLVPTSNILTGSKKNSTPNYQLHNGMSSLAVMCNQCFQQILKSNNDVNGYHVRCDAVIEFKCCLCNVMLSGQQEFAFHKLNTQNGCLINIFGNYLRLPCEVLSPDLRNTAFKILPNQHTMNFHNNLAKNVTAHIMKLKNSTVNGTELLPIKKNTMKNVMVQKNGNVNKTVDTTYHEQSVCSNSDVLKVITSKADVRKKNKSNRIQKTSNLESPDYDLLNESGEIDPNEPRYCLCDQIAYGTMIACDNKACKAEWFHYGCVGIMKPPRGKWYCPKCIKTVKKLKMSKNKPCTNL